MIGWRARLGFMVPPGNPTVEPEMIALAPQGVSVHFQRMDAGGGVPGSLDNQDRRTRSMIDSLDAGVKLLAAVKPESSPSPIPQPATISAASARPHYWRGSRLRAAYRSSPPSARSLPRSNGSGGGSPTARRTRPRRRRRAAPISRRTGSRWCARKTYRRHEHLHETAERAYRLAHDIDSDDAEAVFLTGTGMPTLPVLDLLEADLGKPVISSASAMMWHALRRGGVRQKIAGYGSLLMLE